MKTAYEILQVGRNYVLLIHREDGTTNDYRFSRRSEVDRWLKASGLL